MSHGICVRKDDLKHKGTNDWVENRKILIKILKA